MEETLEDQPAGFERTLLEVGSTPCSDQPLCLSLGHMPTGCLQALHAWLQPTAVSNHCRRQAVSPSNRHLLPSVCPPSSPGSSSFSPLFSLGSCPCLSAVPHSQRACLQHVSCLECPLWVLCPYTQPL